jgi:hypothetical protein
VPLDLLGRTGSGELQVAIGPRLRDRALAWAFGHRRSGAVRVKLATGPDPGTAGGAVWTRRIAGRVVVSAVAWRDRDLVERFGPIELTFRAARVGDGARLDLRDAALTAGTRRMGLPRRLLPAVACTTGPRGGGLVVHVDVRSRRGRPIFDYRGMLT